MSADRDLVYARARRNRRVGLVLASVALTVFFGVMLRYWILK